MGKISKYLVEGFKSYSHPKHSGSIIGLKFLQITSDILKNGHKFRILLSNTKFKDILNFIFMNSSFPMFFETI
jgi:hypothetical protein